VRRRSRKSGSPYGPPSDQPWAWLSEELLASAAWLSMPLCARRALDRIMLENMAHAGKANGDLIVTFDDLMRSGVGGRSGAARAIRILEALGLIDVTIQGHRSFGGAHLPSRYALTWLPRSDGRPATNRWRRIGTHGEARDLVQRATLPCHRDVHARSALDAVAA